MDSTRLSLALALSLLLGSAGPAAAGAPGSANRAGNLGALCEGGPSHGLVCGAAKDCPDGRCRIVGDGLVRQRPFQILATLVIDDDTDAWENDGAGILGDPELGIHTVSAMLEFVAKGRRRVVAQTWANVVGEDVTELLENLTQGVEIADLPNSNRRLDEALGNAAVADRGIIDDFLFQRPDSILEDALRDHFGTDGNFVVARARLRSHADHGGDDPRASVIEMLLHVIVTPKS